MLKVVSGRATDPTEFSCVEVVENCNLQGQLVVQFSEPGAYTPASLGVLNEACHLAGDRLQIRFFGHYGKRFDAACLSHLPNVQNLAVDCLTEIINEGELSRLSRLKRFSFGVFEFDRPEFLSTIDLERLERLVLIQNRKKNIDLAPLAGCETLDELFLNGHSKNISVIAGLKHLRKLSLGSYAKAHSLDFIAAMTSLKDLTLILGGRTDVNDMSSSSVETLQILRVRGLSMLGDLSRFPSLSALRIEDQLQLEQLDLSETSLERLWLFNCKRLAALHGLEMQTRLREFRASGVALDLDRLRDWDWPTSARSIRLFSGSRKWNDEASERLAARGLGDEGDYWS